MAGHYTGRHGAIGERDDVQIALKALLVREGADHLKATMAAYKVSHRIAEFDFDPSLMVVAARELARS